jgi:hypothetical protein
MQLVSWRQTFPRYTCYIDHKCAQLDNCHFSGKCKYGRIICRSDKSEGLVCTSTDNTPILNSVSLRLHFAWLLNSSSSGGSNVVCLDLQQTIFSWKVSFIFYLMTLFTTLKCRMRGQVNKQLEGLCKVPVPQSEVLYGPSEETHEK